MPGLAAREIVDRRALKTPQDFIDQTGVADPQSRLAALNRDGFRGGANVRYRSGQDLYGVIIMRFANSAAALDYMHVHLNDACLIAASMEKMPDLAGVALLRTDTRARATFVSGDTEVNLDICSCVEVEDRVALASRWAADIARQLA